VFGRNFGALEDARGGTITKPGQVPSLRSARV